jgi:hypothetical protein
MCGVEVVKSSDWNVVCYYERADGVTLPEHFWLEYGREDDKQVIVLQTMPGLSCVEIGPVTLRWHDRFSCAGRKKQQGKYRQLRRPIKQLKQRHLDVLAGAARLAQAPQEVEKVDAKS